MRAPDKWDSARFTGIFLVLSFFCTQTLSIPTHLRVTQAVRWNRLNGVVRG